MRLFVEVMASVSREREGPARAASPGDRGCRYEATLAVRDGRSISNSARFAAGEPTADAPFALMMRV